MPPEVRFEGYIASYNPDRGFGFIKQDGVDQPLFFHYSFIDAGIDGIVYQELYSRDDITTIRVSFVINNDERGPQAKQIKPVSEFAEIVEFIKSPNATDVDALEHFFSIATLPAIFFIENDIGLTQLTVQRIIRSPEKWSELVSLAKEWTNATQNLKVASATALFSQFPTTLVQMLKLAPEGQAEIDSTIPSVVQFVEHIDSPLRIFRETRNHSIVILPNTDAIQRTFTKDQGSLTVSNRSNLRLVVLLDETGLDKTLQRIYQEQNIILIRHSTIMKIIVGSEDDYPVILGRNLRKILPIEKLQPYQVGSEYDSSIFSGRLRERERILEDVSGNFAIYGGRKIGKTWFLKDICNSCRDQASYRSIYTPYYVSLQSAQGASEAADLIVEALEGFSEQSLSNATNSFVALTNSIKKIHRETGKTVLLALDELDDLLGKDDAEELFGKLRGLQQTYPGTCKFVFAGFKNLIHAFSDVATNNPFANWIGRNHFPLGCLNEQDLQSLIVRPLKWAGYDFNESQIVRTIFDLTSGHPYYTQSLCYAIVNARFFDNPLHLTSEKLDTLASNDFFLDVFDIFLLNLNTLQLLIGKVFSTESGEVGKPFSEIEIIKALKTKFGFEFSHRQIREEMKILQACSVFAKSASGYFPVMQRINQEFFQRQVDEDLAIQYLEESESGI